MLREHRATEQQLGPSGGGREGMAVVRRTILLLGLMLRASGEQRSIKLVRGASAVDLSPGGSACVASAAPVADAMSGPASLSFLASRRVATAAGDYAAVLFHNVTQHLPDGETHLLGVFRGWSGDGRAMLFGDGEPCPGDLPRNATVVATCDGGPRLALADATEPTMCAYEMKLLLPVACPLFESGWRDAAPPRGAGPPPRGDGGGGVAALRAEADDARRRVAELEAAIAAALEAAESLEAAG